MDRLSGFETTLRNTFILALSVGSSCFGGVVAFIRLTNSSDGLFDDTDVHLQKMILE
jgi:hypothetical protein